MEKHKLNFLPEMTSEEYEKLKADLVANGFDPSQPIWVYEGAILDGWNRYRACDELGIAYAKEVFIGTPLEAVNFVIRTNTRRNLSSGQRAAAAAQAETIIQVLTEATESERRQKQAETLKQTLSQEDSSLRQNFASNSADEQEEEFPDLIYEIEEKVDTRDQNKVASKLAKTFNTNRTYVQEAKKIKAKSPETFLKVASGELSIPQAKKEIAPIPEEVEGAPTNEVTRLAAQYAQSYLRILKEFERTTSSAWNDLQKKGFDVRAFARKLDLFGSNNAAHSISELIAEANLLKGMKVCPKCAGKKCGRCKNTGYLLSEDYKDAKREMENK